MVCLMVAYVGRTTRLPDHLDGWTGQPPSLAPSALAEPDGQRADSLSPLPVVNTPAAAPQRMQIMHYEVQPGDTLGALADRFDISQNTIVWTNDLPPGAGLTPGEQLTILPVSGVLYPVQAGDTVEAIAGRFQTDPGAIAQVNQLADPAHLTPGAQLIVPGGRIEDDPRPDLSSRSSTREPPAVSVPTNARPPLASTSIAGAASAPASADLSLRVPFAARIAPPKPLLPLVYTVAPGDTLTSIATRFGVSPESISFSSGIQSSADNLTIDEKLVIPPVPGIVHVVQAGDTLRSIADRYSADVGEVARANGLSDPFILQPGKSLVIPGGKVPEAAAPEAPAVAAQVTYTVQQGDSLVDIAESYGVSVRTLIDTNGLADPYVLQPGQQLTIPGGSASAVSQSSAQSTSSASSTTSAASTSDAPPRDQPSVSKPAVAAPVARPVAVAVARPAPPAPAPSADGWSIVAIASKYLGYPYVWGGTSPSVGFDCSGFVYYVYRAAGDPIPRDLWGQLQSGALISRGNLMPGDIVSFAGTYEAGLSHDGIYIGGGRFIHAADYGIGVEVSSLSNSYWAAHYFGASRPW